MPLYILYLYVGDALIFNKLNTVYYIIMYNMNFKTMPLQLVHFNKILFYMQVCQQVYSLRFSFYVPNSIQPAKFD